MPNPPNPPPPSSRTALAPNRQAQRQGRALPPASKPHRSTSITPRATCLDATGPGIDPNEKLTVGELCAELKVSRSTFYDWRQKRRGPRCIRLPNGGLRIRRRDLDAWLATQEVA